MDKRKKIHQIGLMVIYDLVTIFLSTMIATVLSAPKSEEYFFYNYYVPSYMAALVFLQIAIYFVLEVYKINHDKFNLFDIGRIVISNVVVLACNIVFVLYTGWFNIMWACCYAGLALLFTLSHRFIFRTIARRNETDDKLEDKSEDKSEDKLENKEEFTEVNN